MRSCPDTEKPLSTMAPFQFLSYETLMDNYIAFKDEIYQRYSEERHDQLRLLVISVAIRQIQMNPSGLLDDEGMSLFNPEAKAIALTGLMLKLKDEINDYFNLFHTFSYANYSLLSTTTNKILFLTGYSERERAFINEKINAAIGMTENHPFDDEALYQVNCILRQLKQWEEFETSKRQQSFAKILKEFLPDLTIFADDKTKTVRSHQSSLELANTYRF